MSNVAAKLNKAGVKKLSPQKKELEPLWDGPESNTPQGGITQSMFDSLLSCRVRAKIGLIDGLSSAEGFSKAIEYGNLWHCCEEGLAKINDGKIYGYNAEGKIVVFKEKPGTKIHPIAPENLWLEFLKVYSKKLAKKYPTQQQEVVKWYEVCRRQFPVYVKHWSKHPDVKERTPILQEVSFRIPYELSSGRVVILRGKFDSVDVIGKGKDRGIWLQENKSKGDIDEPTLQKNLTFDKQTMLYLTALAEAIKDPDNTLIPEEFKKLPLKGVRYNVIRRPLSGGKGSIRPHAAKETKKGFTPAETDQHYYDRLLNDYILAEPAYWFMRWSAEVAKSEIEVYKTTFLNPFLENVCWWYDLQVGNPVDVSKFDLNCLHYRLPFGCYNSVNEGWETDACNYLRTGSTVGLVRRETLFPELELSDGE